jgi:hypothetical protein
LRARRGFVGLETITLTVSDPEGNTATGTIKVYVRTSARLELYIIPNPISTDYIDIVVFATDTLVGYPSVNITVNDKTTTLDVQKVPNALIWKADYEFQEEVTGSIKVKTVAADNFGSTISDSTTFTIGVITKTAGYHYEDSQAHILIPPGILNKSEKIIILSDEQQKYFQWITTDIHYPETLGNPIISYYVSLGNVSLKKNGTIEFALDKNAVGENNTSHYGIYTVDSKNKQVRFISNTFDENRYVLSASFEHSGLYIVAGDYCPPEVSAAGTIDPISLSFAIRVKEQESGIKSIYTVIDGIIYQNTVSQNKQDSKIFEIKVDGFSRTGNYILKVYITDNAGNTSNVLEIPFMKRQSALPATYELLQNYPNPFNPSTTIRYQLPQKEYVSLIIYNSMGQMVKTVVNGCQEAGFYSVKWDGCNDGGVPVASGIYFTVLKTEHCTKKIRMMLIK